METTRAMVTTILERPKVELKPIFTEEELKDGEFECHICSSDTEEHCVRCRKPTCSDHLRYWCRLLGRLCPSSCVQGLRLCTVCAAELTKMKGR